MSVRSLARKAGVSPMTVSLALRNHPRISRATRERIHALAARLGHVPNPKLSALMNEVRQSRAGTFQATLGLIAIYPDGEPVKYTPHLAACIRGARQRGAELGYAFDEFWLGARGLTPRRVRGILEARGVQGILCLGAYEPDTPLPADFDRFAVVTLGMSISSGVHRVVSYHQRDALTLLHRLKQLGYARPGIIMQPEWELRSAYGYTSAALLFQDRFLSPPAVPALRLMQFDAAVVSAWMKAHAPDVVILHQPAPFFRAFESLLRAQKRRVPRDLGVVFLGVDAEDPFYAGMAQDHELIARCGLELLVGRIDQRDFGFPAVPKIEFVEGHWVDGASVRAH